MSERPLRILVVAPVPEARAAIRSALSEQTRLEALFEAGDVLGAAGIAAREHVDLIVVAVSPRDEETGRALPQLLGVAAGSQVLLTLLEQWAQVRPERGYDLRDIVEVLREAREADDPGEAGRRREGTLSLLAHDMLTPATAIVGLADVLLRYWERFGEQERREAVGNIAQVGRDLASLVKGIVRAASADAGSLIGDREPAPVPELLEEAVEATRRIAPNHTIELKLIGEPAALWVDRLRVQEAVLNFLANAVKYSPVGTTVRLVAESDHREVRIAVTDEGPGIPEEDRPRLFKKFSRLKPEDTSGHGLGLYLVKAIVEAHGGRVWVDSEIGGGSTFGMALPATGRTRQAGS